MAIPLSAEPDTVVVLATIVPPFAELRPYKTLLVSVKLPKLAVMVLFCKEIPLTAQLLILVPPVTSNVPAVTF